MSRKSNDNNVLCQIIKASAIVATFAFTAFASPKTVTLTFVDSAMVNDTLIRVGDIARINSDDADLAARVRRLSIGESAPAGFSRFVNTEDLVIFRLQPQLEGVRINADNHKRIKVLTDHQDRTVGEYEELIRAYVGERLGWGSGEWELAINNLEHRWKTARGHVDAEITGLDNPFSKGNVNLTLTARRGSRAHRVPVQCRIVVKAPALVATRTIQRGEEFTSDNSMLQVVDITNFAFVPLRELPAAGTMTAARTLSQGNILHDRMLRAIPIVARGDQVRISFIGERVKISVLGVARDNGGVGDRIWVENSQTGKLIRAAVSGRGSVVVHQEGDRT